MRLEIRGHHLPGRSFHADEGPCDNVHVGLQVGHEPHGLVAGDAEEAVWTTELTVVASDGDPDVRGPAVQGRRGERFVYLTWGDVDADGAFHMVRRATLMCADLTSHVDAAHLVATVDLTDELGAPRCARLRPPALALSTA